MKSAAYPVAIDNAAPVVSRRHLLIPAPRNRVWQAHVDVARWPGWQTDISAATIDGPVAPGSTITWSTIGIDEPIPSLIYAVEPLSRTLWGGTAMGIVGIHEWRFSDVGDDTLVETVESWAGDPVAADPIGMQAALDASLDAWLDRLRDLLNSKGALPSSTTMFGEGR